MWNLKTTILAGALLTSLPFAAIAEPRCVDITGNFTTGRCATREQVDEYRAQLNMENIEKAEENPSGLKGVKPKLRLGMGAKYILSTGWGDKKTILKITTVETRYGTLNTIIYKDGKMLYFQDGLLESIVN